MNGVGEAGGCNLFAIYTGKKVGIMKNCFLFEFTINWLVRHPDFNPINLGERIRE